MKINYSRVFITVMAGMFLTYMPVQAAEVAKEANVRHLSGEIVRVDVKLGIIQLNVDLSPDTGEVTEYKINKNDTRVTDPLDEKFLTIDDLQVGQFVILDIAYDAEDKIIRKITAQPYLKPGLLQAFGDIEVIDDAAGTLTLEERPMGDNTAKGSLSYFVFAPKDIVIMQDPSIEPVLVVLKPGDLIRVVYEIRDGKKYAQSITLYKPRVTQTTVTTTTTTTQ